MVRQYLKERVTLRIYDRDSARLEGIPQASTFDEVTACDLVILSVPISEMEGTCTVLGQRVRPGQVVVDTCSVKTRPMQWMLREFPEGVDVLGTHPLFGPDSGKDGIAGLKIALCPARIAPARYDEICRFLKSLELVLVETTAEEHDRQIALSQAIFHLIAQVMHRLDWGVKPISTPGPESFYRLVKTVQRDTSQLFNDMERENPFAAECRKTFIEELIKIDRELERQRGGGD